jgi:hypothetical protein
MWREKREQETSIRTTGYRWGKRCLMLLTGCWIAWLAIEHVQLQSVQAETLQQATSRLAPVIRSGGDRSFTQAERIQRELADWKEWQLANKRPHSIVRVAEWSGVGGSSNALLNPYDGKSTPHGAIIVAYHRTGQGAWCTATISGYCHIGLFNRNVYRNETSLAIRTANLGKGMLMETPRYWRHFQEVREMEVWTVKPQERNLAVQFAMGYNGPYVFGLKYTTKDWYCSKVVFRAYFDAAKIDLDEDGGVYVLPGDIRWSRHTRTIKVYAS